MRNIFALELLRSGYPRLYRRLWRHYRAIGNKCSRTLRRKYRIYQFSLQADFEIFGYPND